MTPQDRIHHDLRMHLRNKIRRAIQDHVEMCETMDIPDSDTCGGLADLLMQLVASYFVLIDKMTPQQYGQLCHDSFKELREEQAEREA